MQAHQPGLSASNATTTRVPGVTSTVSRRAPGNRVSVDLDHRAHANASMMATSRRGSRERDWLLARIAAAPDLTGQALRADLAERGTKVSYDAVWRFLREERLTLKKSLRAPSRTVPTSTAARAVEAPPAPR